MSPVLGSAPPRAYGTCDDCGRRLRDPVSLAAGRGPVCRRKHRNDTARSSTPTPQARPGPDDDELPEPTDQLTLWSAPDMTETRIAFARPDEPSRYFHRDVDGDRLLMTTAAIPGQGPGVYFRTDPTGASVPLTAIDGLREALAEIAAEAAADPAAIAAGEQPAPPERPALQHLTEIHEECGNGDRARGYAADLLAGHARELAQLLRAMHAETYDDAGQRTADGVLRSAKRLDDYADALNSEDMLPPDTECPAGLLPLDDAPAELCVRRGPHEEHRTAAGRTWTGNAEETTP